jgi:tetratricopeptide (TPR) repeat protein
MHTVQRLRIFAASTSDTAAERAKVETAAMLLKPLADKFGIVLEVVDWRSVVPDMGRPEQVILDQLKPTDWDVFIGILWHRFGTPPGGADPQSLTEYLSGTEEEFKTAYRLWKQHRKPRVMMYRCTRPVPLDLLDLEQLKRVKEFFAQFEATTGKHPGLYQSFETPEAFEKLLVDNLQKLLIACAEQLEGKPVAPEVVQALAPKCPDNLPRRVSFFGRDKEMETVLRALSPEARTWGILVDGIGGIGKTALAAEAAHRCKEQGLFDAFVFVSAKQNILMPDSIRELTPVARTIDEFLNETARVLGQTAVPQLAGDAKRRALLEALRETRTLLIYDNLETLTKEEQEGIAAFLGGLPQGCKAIITSRRRGGEGAIWLRLEKLDWDAARQFINEEAQKDSDLKAKLQRAGEKHWPKLYDATGGSPLALSHTLGLMRVRASLTFDRALEMLRGKRDDDELQNFIFQEARGELTTNDQTALRALSFFAPSATFEAWAEVAQLSRTSLETTIDRLSALSLIDALAGEERFTLHPITRNFVRNELLADAQISHETGMRFSGYWLAHAQRYGGGSVNYKTFNLIEAEWANLDASAEWLWQTAVVQGEEIKNPDAAHMFNKLTRALCSAVGPMVYIGRWDESLQLSGRAYEATRILAEWENAGYHAYCIAKLHDERAETDETVRWADRCVEASERGGNIGIQILGVQIRGTVARRKKEYGDAEQLFQSALAIARRLGWDQHTVYLLNELGVVEYERGNYDAAEGYYREALALGEKIGSKDGVSNLCYWFGFLFLDRKMWTDAREWFERGLSLASDLGRQDLISFEQYGLARVHEEEGRPDLALPLALQALAIAEKLRDRGLLRRRELVNRLKKKMGEQQSL